MPAHKAPRMQPHPVGQQQDGEQYQGDQQDKRFQRKRSITAQKRNHLGERPHNQQINSGQ